MIKLLLLALGAWVIYRILKSYSRNVEQDQESPPAASEDMVRCVHCGVHLPRSEAVVSQDKFFCNNEHRQLHQK